MTAVSGDPLQTGDEISRTVERARDNATLELLAEEFSVAKETLETGRGVVDLMPLFGSS